jgi:hypothetical protein
MEKQQETANLSDKEMIERMRIQMQGLFQENQRLKTLLSIDSRIKLLLSIEESHCIFDEEFLRLVRNEIMYLVNGYDPQGLYKEGNRGQVNDSDSKQ